MGYSIDDINKALNYTVEDMILIETFLLRTLRIDSKLLRNIRTLLNKLLLLFEKYDNVRDIVDHMEIDGTDLLRIEELINFYGAQMNEDRRDFENPRTEFIYRHLFHVRNILKIR